MKLPHMKYSDGITKNTQVKFGGYNHSLYARDGDIYDMRNVTSEHFPLICQRKKRGEVPFPELTVWKGTGYVWSGNDTLILPVNIAVNSEETLNIHEGQLLSLGNVGEFVVSEVYYSDNGNILNPLFIVGEEVCQLTFNTNVFSESVEKEHEELEVKVLGSGANLCTKQPVPDTSDNGYVEKIVNNTKTEYIYEDGTMTIQKTVTKTDEDNSITRVMRYTTPVTYSEEIEYTVELIKIDKDNSYSLKVRNGTLSESIKKYDRLYFDYEPLLGYHFAKQDYNETDFSNANDWIYLYSNLQDKTVESLKSVKVLRARAVYGKTEEEEAGAGAVPGEEVVISEDNKSLTEIITKEVTFYQQTVTVTNEVYELTPLERKILSIDASGDDIYILTDDGAFYYNGVYCGMGLSDKSDKVYAQTGAYLFVIPDNVYINRNTNRIVKSNSITKSWIYNSTQRNYLFSNSLDFIWGEDISGYFKTDESVNVTIFFQNGEKAVVTGTVNASEYLPKGKNMTITFTENIFSKWTIDKNGNNMDVDEINGKIRKITVNKGMPELKYICACNNRFWGCDGDTIYCSAFGEPLEWFRYDASNEGNVADISWAVTPFDQSGEFCGCCVYDDTPIFFKEDRIYRVYGQNATNFNVRCDERAGLISGGEKTLDIVNDNLFYLSPTGIMRMYGNTVQEISGEFYETFVRGVSGDDGRRYFIEAENSKGEKKLFVFDTKKGIWTVEEAVGAKCFLKYKGKLYAYCEDSSLICMTPGEDMTFALSGEEMELENNFKSFIEFGDYYCNSPDKKGVSKIYMRLSAESGSKVSVYINYDSERTHTGERIWNRIKELEPDIKKSVILPVIPRRCDHFRIRLEALGGFCLYSLSYEYYNGSAI